MWIVGMKEKRVGVPF